MDIFIGIRQVELEIAIEDYLAKKGFDKATRVSVSGPIDLLKIKINKPNNSFGQEYLPKDETNGN